MKLEIIGKCLKPRTLQNGEIANLAIGQRYNIFSTRYTMDPCLQSFGGLV